VSVPGREVRDAPLIESLIQTGMTGRPLYVGSGAPGIKDSIRGNPGSSQGTILRSQLTLNNFDSPIGERDLEFSGRSVYGSG
jgi:hypothetical protein